MRNTETYTAQSGITYKLVSDGPHSAVDLSWTGGDRPGDNNVKVSSAYDAYVLIDVLEEIMGRDPE